MPVVYKFTSLVVSLSVEVTHPCLEKAFVSLPFCACVTLSVKALQIRRAGCNLPVTSKKWRQIKPFASEDAVMLRVWAKFVKRVGEEALEAAFTVTE